MDIVFLKRANYTEYIRHERMRHADEKIDEKDLDRSG